MTQSVERRYLKLRRWNAFTLMTRKEPGCKWFIEVVILPVSGLFPAEHPQMLDCGRHV